jgi:IS30 family transposase
MGTGSLDCIVTLVERKSGYTLIGKLNDRTTASLNKKVIRLIKSEPARFMSITADNGTEFHQYQQIEKKTEARFYFADPYHSWQRGTNENTNGLIRQFLPKGTSMAELTQPQCNFIAAKLNNRPRKRHNFKTPEEILYA